MCAWEEEEEPVGNVHRDLADVTASPLEGLGHQGPWQGVGGGALGKQSSSPAGARVP